MHVIYGEAAMPALQRMNAPSIKALRNAALDAARTFVGAEPEDPVAPFSVFGFKGRLVRVNYDVAHDEAQIVSIS